MHCICVPTSIQLPILTKHIASDRQKGGEAAEEEEAAAAVGRNIIKRTQREVQSRFTYKTALRDGDCSVVSFIAPGLHLIRMWLMGEIRYRQ